MNRSWMDIVFNSPEITTENTRFLVRNPEEFSSTDKLFKTRKKASDYIEKVCRNILEKKEEWRWFDISRFFTIILIEVKDEN